MEERLKQRLTGAAILVALIVLIVPELFHGHRADRGGKAVSASEGPPMRSYTDRSGCRSFGADAAGCLIRARPGRISRSQRTECPCRAGRVHSGCPTGRPVRSGADEQLAERPGGSAASRAQEHRPGRTSRQRAGTRERCCQGGRADRAGQSGSAQQLELLLRARPPPTGACSSGCTPSAPTPSAWCMSRTPRASRPASPSPMPRAVITCTWPGLTTRSAAMTLAARLRAAGLPAAAVGPR